MIRLDPPAWSHRKAKLARMRKRWRQQMTQLRRARNPAAADVRDPGGPFRPRVVEPRNRPARHPRHRLRAMAELLA